MTADTAFETAFLEKNPTTVTNTVAALSNAVNAADCGMDGFDCDELNRKLAVPHPRRAVSAKQDILVNQATPTRIVVVEESCWLLDLLVIQIYLLIKLGAQVEYVIKTYPCARFRLKICPNNCTATNSGGWQGQCKFYDQNGTELTHTTVVVEDASSGRAAADVS